MAEIPTPRSYSQILGDMVDAFLSRFGLKSLKVGSPVLSMLEAAAQSDLRSSEDVFQMLSAISLDTASGPALDRIAADEDMTRIGDTAATGSVTITDSRYTKKATKIFQGIAAPTAGSSVVYVLDAAGWPATGSIYIGRGTSNYEGPLAYTSITNNGYYYAINLTGTTQNYHNQSESVILAQGGNRTISAGTTVRTPQGNYTQAVDFATVYGATIPDGEVSIDNVLCTAQQPGVIGNVAAGGISQFQNVPFTGATVTNSLPFSNGLAAEDDQTLRERIRNVRASRAKGTSLALQTGVIGLVSTEENKRVTAASVVSRKGDGTTVYIDDGTGYEEKTAGLDYEILQDSALGGELYFQLAAPKPIVKAFATSAFPAPFTLTSGATLAVKVGGVLSEHTFDASEFRSISDAAVYEVVASINGNENLAFAARTANNGTAVSIFAKTETNEDIEVVAPATGYDANDHLGFPAGKVETLRLYKNDRLLSKDGSRAVITGNSTSEWTAISANPNPVSLTISVDGTPATTYYITDASFVNAGTGYTTASQTNSVTAWATVLNATVPGITATANGDSISITSNRGASSSASIVISGGSLVSSKMFEVVSAYGSDNDYTLDRNTGQLKLAQALAAGDRLTAGTLYTRAFVESSALSRVDLSTNTAKLYFAVDGNATIVPTSINSTVTLTISSSSIGSGSVKRETITASSAIFGNVMQGDWLILWDTAFDTNNRGVFRIASATSNAISVERDSTWTNTQTTTLATNGMVVVRSTTPIQTLSITGNNWAASNLVAAINSQIKGVTATTYRTNRVRVYTNTYGIEGDIAFLTADTYGKLFKFTAASYISNLTSHVGSVTSPKARGTPSFGLSKLSAATSSLLTLANNGMWGDSDEMYFLYSGGNVVWGQSLASNSLNRFSTNYGQSVTLSAATSLTSLSINGGTTMNGLPDEGVRFEASLDLGAEDSLSVLVDGDTASKNYNIPLYRTLKPAVSTAYSNTVTLVDGNGESIAKAFGTGFNFADCALYMKARTVSHPSSSPDKRILWRFYRYGAAGVSTKIAYVYPAAPSLPLAVSTSYSTNTPFVKVALPSGSRKSLTDIRNSTSIGIFATHTGNAPYTVTLVSGYSISAASRTGTTTTLTLSPYTNQGELGIAPGDSIFVQSNNVNFPSGMKTVTGVVGSPTFTVAYTDYVSGTASATNIGTVSRDSAEAKWTNVQVGDILTITSTSGFGPTATPYTLTMRVNATQTGATSAIQGISGVVEALPSGYSPSATPTFYRLSNAGGLYLYPLGSALSIQDIADAVNALTNSPVSAKALGTLTQTVTLATFEEMNLAGDSAYYLFTDGINWVKSNTNPAVTTDNYTFTVKMDASPSLTGSDTDWANEEVRIVPVTTAGLVRWLNSSAVAGLSTVGGVVASDNGSKLQLSTSAMGAAGSVQVQGGTANALSFPVYGSASAPAGTANARQPVLLKVRTSDVAGLNGGAAISIQNTNLTQKALSLSGATVSISSAGVVAVTGASFLWKEATTTGPMYGMGWRVEKHGKFAAYIWSSADIMSGTPWTLDSAAGTSLEGNWVRIAGGNMSSANTGIFRVVRAYENVANDIHAFWVENEDAIEETKTADTVQFLTYNSIIPGDKLSIGTKAFGLDNKGDWTIDSVDYGYPNNSGNFIFTISRSSGVAPTVVSPAVVVTSLEASRIQFSSGVPDKLYKSVVSMIPSTVSGYTDLLISGVPYYQQISEMAGSIVRAEDKLGFDTDLHTGIDGYNYNTGLIQEVSRVVYGDPSSPASYPGIAAAGANVYVSGPLVKRIQVALALRVRSGVASGETVQLAKSAVASVVNASPLGQPIAISDIVAAVNILDGVQAVSVISPTYNSGNDLISVQPYEKPLVQNLDQDVLISLVGD